MLEYPYEIGTEPVTVRVVEDHYDLVEFTDWFNDAGSTLGLDSETTGLDTYADGNRLRTVQFGDSDTGWVIPVETDQGFTPFVLDALNNPSKRFVLHNASFDLQVFQRHLGVPMSSLWPRVSDTKIYAHLVDPRGQEEGGSGHGLEQLTRRYISERTADEVKASMGLLAKELKITKANLWALPELTDNPTFHLYAGLDPILAVRLFYKLQPLVPAKSFPLIKFEHELAVPCAEMEANGFLLDSVYAKDLSVRLQAEEDEASLHALTFFDVESVNSTEQVADALEYLGVRITERTPTGRRKVDGKLLESLSSDQPEVGTAAHLAAAVLEAKSARKRRTTWVDGFLAGADSSGRIHPSINPLRARTARMSITGIPAQTLPSGDWIIRRCFLADEGHKLAHVDYKNQELRVLAALCGDPTMLAAFESGDDLHQITADAAGVSRKVGKMANFLTVFGGGSKALALQGNIDLATAKRVLAAFDKTYPQVKVYSDKLMKQAQITGCIYTPTGRRLPVDKDRSYSALNYMVQSTSRDVTCRGILRLHEAGFTPYLRLPVHDEVVVSLPADRAEWGAKRIAELMRMDFMGVDIDTDPEVGNRSWGSFYNSDY